MTRNLKDVLRDIASLCETDKAVLVGILVGSLNRRLDENEQPQKVPTEEHDRELHRLTEQLREIAQTLTAEAQRQTIERAALGLSVLGSVGLWPLFERWWRERNDELSESERAHLRSMAIDPDRN